MPLDEKIILLMREAFAGYSCGELTPGAEPWATFRGCGQPAGRQTQGRYWCHSCWMAYNEPPPPVECHTSGNPEMGWGKRRG